MQQCQHDLRESVRLTLTKRLTSLPREDRLPGMDDVLHHMAETSQPISSGTPYQPFSSRFLRIKPSTKVDSLVWQRDLDEVK